MSMENPATITAELMGWKVDINHDSKTGFSDAYMCEKRNDCSGIFTAGRTQQNLMSQAMRDNSVL